jgi:hypothetical protein
METCFVIQPFDNDKFDKRYNDIFKPAIEKANLTPYRIDKDLSVRIPIEDIERGILESSICFAEITTDNPNVWYELGFAFACQKDVILVCSEERINLKFPFDIQHRHVIVYKTGSKSDYETLELTITQKINAFRQKGKILKTLNSTPVISTEGLRSHELAILILVMENQLTSDDSLSIYYLKSEMSKSGYTDIATSVGLRTLVKKGLIETFTTIDEYSNSSPFPACRLTGTGEAWLLQNEQLLVFRKDTDKHTGTDDLPF